MTIFERFFFKTKRKGGLERNKRRAERDKFSALTGFRNNLTKRVGFLRAICHGYVSTNDYLTTFLLLVFFFRRLINKGPIILCCRAIGRKRIECITRMRVTTMQVSVRGDRSLIGVHGEAIPIRYCIQTD